MPALGQPPSIRSEPPPRSFWRRVKKFVIALLIVYLGLIGMLAWLQRSLMYQGRKGPVQVADAEEHADHLRECYVTAADGVKLHGWLSLCDAESEIGRSQPLSQLGAGDRYLVVMFAGNAGNRLSRISQLDLYNGLGCDALLFDYRGYAENAGSPTETDLLRDARTVWDYATNVLKVPPERIVISGESLGGGVATALASELCREGHSPAALVLRATFSSMVETASGLYWWLPVRWVLLDTYQSIERMPHVTCPVLTYHGTADEIIPFEQGVRLFESAPPTARNGIEKRFLQIPGAGHNDIYQIGQQEIAEAIRVLLAEVQSISPLRAEGVSLP